MTTATATRTATQRGAAIVTAYNLEAELAALYAAQEIWCNEQAAIGDAIHSLECKGFVIRPRHSWAWCDSPHAARIAEIENTLGV